MNTRIREFISGKRIAVVGASRTNDKYKFGNMAAVELKRRGYGLLRPPASPNDQWRGDLSEPERVEKQSGWCAGLRTCQQGNGCIAGGGRGGVPQCMGPGRWGVAGVDPARRGIEAEPGHGQVHLDVRPTGAELPYDPSLHCPGERPVMILCHRAYSV
jgi:hypothetical protein